MRLDFNYLILKNSTMKGPSMSSEALAENETALDQAVEYKHQKLINRTRSRIQIVSTGEVDVNGLDQGLMKYIRQINRKIVSPY